MKEFFDRADMLERDRSFDNIYKIIIANRDNTAFEYLEGGRVARVGYAEFDVMVRKTASALDAATADVPRGSFVGIRMENSVAWAAVFWALMMCGKKPLMLAPSCSSAEAARLMAHAGGDTVISADKVDGLRTVISGEVFMAGSPEFAGKFAGEIAFCTSGTTGEQKICVFDAENISSQICGARIIPDYSPDVMYPHSTGVIRVLALLPFYHIFGFVSVFLWYLFFGRTVVFVGDISPDGIMYTCRRLRVTHIYSVPLLWDSVYRLTIKKAGGMKGLVGRVLRRLVEHSGDFSRGLHVAAERVASKFILKTLRQKIFGDSVKFMISGGGFISPKTISFVNSLGYPLHNGYGATEIGITSVNLSSERALCIDANVGRPLLGVEYKISPMGNGKTVGSLLVRSAQVCRGYMRDGKFIPRAEEWYDTGDLVRQGKNGSYYVLGRVDEVIKSPSGEKIIPVEMESYFSALPGVKNLCLLEKQGELILLVESETALGNQYLRALLTEFSRLNAALPFYKQVRGAYVTNEAFPLAMGVKIKRGELRWQFLANPGKFKLLQANNSDDRPDIFSMVPPGIVSVIRGAFSDELSLTPEDIDLEDDFIVNLGGDSLSYLSLIVQLESVFTVRIDPVCYSKLKTVHEFSIYINERITEKENEKTD